MKKMRKEFLEELKKLMDKYNVEIEMCIEENEEEFNSWFEIHYSKDDQRDTIFIDGSSIDKEGIEWKIKEI